MVAILRAGRGMTETLPLAASALGEKQRRKKGVVKIIFIAAVCSINRERDA